MVKISVGDFLLIAKILDMKQVNRSDLVAVIVDREIRPVGTGMWSLPPLPHREPNFTRLARGK